MGTAADPPPESGCSPSSSSMDDFFNPTPTPTPQPPPPTPITPTQTDVSHHLGQKGDILSLFAPSSTSAPGPPSNPSSPIGDFEGGLAPPSGGSLILSNSFTEPGPVELDPLGDMFGDGEKKPAAAAGETPQLPTFYIDESDSAKKEGNGEAKVDEQTVKEEEATTPVAQQQTSRFWSWWSRSKSEAGSKENILEEGEKKPGEEGRGGNDQKFLGEGQSFKGKLIGVLEVAEARGDRMCQDALQELKTAIRASGEHKQRIVIHVAVDGLKIRDEKSGDCLYHHPVHKISFIAQDVANNRAFGYIYGSPENGHRFFGIKTEKAAGQVVVAMRDLFQVVFELKKKEIDEAKQNIDAGENESAPVAVPSAASFPDGAAPPAAKTTAMDDLLGLESEISAIQAGIQQIDKITPTPPMSFQTESMMPLDLGAPAPSQAAPEPQLVAQARAAQPKRPVAVMSQAPPGRTENYGTAPFLPPPPPKPGRRPEPPQEPKGGYSVFGPGVTAFDSIIPPPTDTMDAPAAPIGEMPSFMGSSMGSMGSSTTPGVFPMDSGSLFSSPTLAAVSNSQLQEVGQPSASGSQDLASLFTDLDPLGSGKSKPFVDKKDFFYDSKTKMKLTGASEDSLTNKSELPMTANDPSPLF